MPKTNAGKPKIDALSEAELAAYLEEHQGDVSLWEQTPSKIRIRRGGPSTIFSLRLAPEELEDLHAAAVASGKTLSDFIRTAALREAKQPSERERSLDGALAQVDLLQASLAQLEHELRNEAAHPSTRTPTT